MARRARSRAALLTASSLALLLALPTTAQDEPAVTTISSIERGVAEGHVYLEGAALAQAGDVRYLFSDGTGVVALDLEPSATPGPLPLFELIGVEGTVVDDGVAVATWELLPIMTPAVIVPEAQVIEAFWTWIIAFGSQEPA